MLKEEPEGKLVKTKTKTSKNNAKIITEGGKTVSQKVVARRKYCFKERQRMKGK